MVASGIAAHSVHLDAGIGAHRCTRRTADAVLWVLGVGIMIATVVHLLGLELKNIGRASHHAQVASLAALAVNCHGSINFCHNDYSINIKVTAMAAVLRPSYRKSSKKFPIIRRAPIFFQKKSRAVGLAGIF